ncbi:MAG: HD domain-containing protein [Syntrophorhabdales bacterium]|jgi:hypothetical protein
MFDTIKTVVAILFEKDPPQEKIVLSLDDLCPLWIKYNTSFKTAEEKPRKTETVQQPVPAAASEPEAAASSPPPTGRAHVLVQAFYSEVVEPCREALVKNNMLEGLNRIMDLLEQHGDCSSVAVVPWDSEKGELKRVGDILSRVSLRQHSFHVTRIALGLLKEAYKDPVGYIPLMLIAGLGHDLGKIPALRKEGPYAKADHPRLSVAALEEIFARDVHTHWFGMVRKAVAEHHESTTDLFSALLKEADGRARQLEIDEEGHRASLSWETWFDVTTFLAMVGAKVDVIQTGHLWYAFSIDGTVYCDPTFLYETAGALALTKNVLDIALLRDTDKDRALGKIVRSLRRANAVTAALGEGYTTRRFLVEIEQAPPTKMSLVPLRTEAFPNHAQFEETKKTYPPIVRSVRAL